MYLDNVRRLAAQARHVTSVCTGSLLLGAAGLLRGKRAACHWAFRELLPLFGAIPDRARVVRDGNLITGGGVTAGIDMALTGMTEIAGRDYAGPCSWGSSTRPSHRSRRGARRRRAQVVAAARGRIDAIWPDRLAVARRAGAALPPGNT